MFPKLIQVSEVRYEPEIAVEGKGYITVNIGRDSRATNLYWRLVDPVFSLLELGFEHPSGRLMNCAVPLFNGEIETSEAQAVVTGSGTPFFDLSPWPLCVTGTVIRGRHLSQEGRIRMTRLPNGLSIVLKEATWVRSIAYGSSLVCSVDESNELSAINLVGEFDV